MPVNPVHERSVELAGARLRGLLIRLAVDVPRPVSQATLVEALWGEEPPLDPANALQSLVSRLRRALGDSDLVLQIPGGYRLNVERDDVDIHHFAEVARQGRASLRSGNTEPAVGLLREALKTWRGPTPEGWGDTTDSSAHQTRLCEQRLDVTADLMEAELALGRHADVVAELEDSGEPVPAPRALRRATRCRHWRARADKPRDWRDTNDCGANSPTNSASIRLPTSRQSTSRCFGENSVPRDSQATEHR